MKLLSQVIFSCLENGLKLTVIFVVVSNSHFPLLKSETDGVFGDHDVFSMPEEHYPAFETLYENIYLGNK